MLSLMLTNIKGRGWGDSPQSDCYSWAGRCSTAAHWTLDLWPLGCIGRPPCSRCAESRPATLTQWCHCSETTQSPWRDLRDLSGSPSQWEATGTVSWWTRCRPASSRPAGACHRWQTAAAELMGKSRREGKKKKKRGRNWLARPSRSLSTAVM